MNTILTRVEWFARKKAVPLTPITIHETYNGYLKWVEIRAKSQGIANYETAKLIGAVYDLLYACEFVEGILAEESEEVWRAELRGLRRAIKNARIDSP